jgi:DNA-binding NarL/FixJ family response regulator
MTNVRTDQVYPHDVSLRAAVWLSCMRNHVIKVLVEQLLAHPEVRSVSVELDGETYVADQGLVVPLTSRQHEVALLVSRGCTNREIADMLAISTNAVKKHVSRVLDAIGASNRTELAARAAHWQLAEVKNA